MKPAKLMNANAGSSRNLESKKRMTVCIPGRFIGDFGKTINSDAAELFNSNKKSGVLLGLMPKNMRKNLLDMNNSPGKDANVFLFNKS